MQVRSNSRFALLKRRDTGCAATKWLPYTGIILFALTIVPLQADPADQTLLLDVQVNGHSINKVGEFTMRDGELMARRSELRDLGFTVPLILFPKNPIHGAPEPDELVALSDVPGLTWSIDQKSQQLILTATDVRLLPTLLQVDARESPSGRRVIETGKGITLNYDIVGTSTGGQAGASGLLDLRAFSPWGIVSSGWLGYAGATSSGSGKNTAIRLDSTYTFADVNTLRRYSLGDFITGGLVWTRPIHLEGVQVSSDFSMRPDLVTFPLPSVSGSASVPSTLDVLSDGNLVVSREIDAGPFEIPQLPVITGAGTISMTVTNALGEQVNVTQPFYASSALLAPGLQTFAVQAGLVRRNWGSISNDYGKIAGTAIYRRGVTPKFTIEGSVEGTPGTVMAGAGGVAQMGNLGVINFSVATSMGTGHPGAQFSIGAQRIGRVFSLGASAIVAGHNYLDVAAMNGAPVPRKQLGANAGLSLRLFGSMGVAYAGLDQSNSPNPVTLDIVGAQHSHIFSANYSIQIHHMSIYATEFRDFTSSGSTNGLQVGLTIPLGKRSSIGVSGATDGSAQVQVQQSAALIGEWGYQAYVSAPNSPHEFAQVQYKSPWALFTAGVDHDDAETTLRLETEGAVSFVDGGLFLSNTVYDSFAIVDTSPMAHVHVLQENRDVGRTDSAGRILVPDMRAFDLNHIAIDPADIPPDATIAIITREVRPQDRSGVVVKFPVKISHGAILRLVDKDGVAVPLGSTATLQGTGMTVPIGYDGEAYVEDLNTHNKVDVEQPDGRRCSVAFDYQPVPGEIPAIGPLRCEEQRP
jgi:outer membrane usher protein